MTKTIDADEKWIKKLAGCKTSDDFEKALQGLYSDNITAKSLRERLKGDLDAALFAGKDINDINRKLTDLTLEIDANDGAINGCIMRKDTALKAEKDQRRLDVKADNDALDLKYRDVLKNMMTNIEVVMNDFAEVDRLERAIERNNDELESTCTNQAALAGEKAKLKKIRRETMRDTFVKESDVPRDLSINGKRWQRWWLKLLTWQEVAIPE
jgi:hypothetical protein